MADRKGLKVVRPGRPTVRKKASKTPPPESRSRILLVPLPDGTLLAFDKESMLQVRLLNAIEVILDDGKEWQFCDYRE